MHSLDSQPASQANSKFSPIPQSPAKIEQRQSKKNAWIFLVSLRRIELFQWLTRLLGQKKFFLRSFSLGAILFPNLMICPQHARGEARLFAKN
jgi:hypothetical protein